MSLSDEIMRMVGEAETVVVPVAETSDLYTDLGYDSLAFVSLLLEIEKVYSIRFELLEMSTCLRVDRLIALVERKIEESKHD